MFRLSLLRTTAWSDGLTPAFAESAEACERSQPAAAPRPQRASAGDLAGNSLRAEQQRFCPPPRQGLSWLLNSGRLDLD